MNKSIEILTILRPNGGWTIQGDDFNTIQYFDNCVPLTEEEIANGENLLSIKAIEKEATRAAILDRLGLTADEAALLLG